MLSKSISIGLLTMAPKRKLTLLSLASGFNNCPCSILAVHLDVCVVLCMSWFAAHYMFIGAWRKPASSVDGRKHNAPNSCHCSMCCYHCFQHALLLALRCLTMLSDDCCTCSARWAFLPACCTHCFCDVYHDLTHAHCFAQTLQALSVALAKGLP